MRISTQDYSNIVQVNRKYNNTKLDAQKYNDIVEACANDGYEHIYKLVFHDHLHQFNSMEAVPKKVLVTATIRSSFTFIKLLYESTIKESIRNMKVDADKAYGSFTFSLLDIATIRGHYQLVELLLYKFNFKQSINNKPYSSAKIYDLIRKCIEKTAEANEREINYRKQILELINSISFEPEIYNITHPLAAIRRVHPVLLFKTVELLKLGSTDEVGQRNVEETLRYSTELLDADNFIKLVDWVRKQAGNDMKAILNSKIDKYPWVLKIADGMEFTPNLVMAIKDWELEIPGESVENSILRSAITYRKNIDTIALILQSYKFSPKELLSAVALLIEQKCFATLPLVMSVMDVAGNTESLMHILQNVDEPRPSLQLCEIAVKNGAKLHPVENWNISPLHMALMKSRESAVVDHLIQSGSNVNEEGEEGKTPLMYMKALSHLDLLLKNNACLFKLDNRGKTCLHHAVEDSASYKMVRALIAAGANTNLSDHTNLTLVNVRDLEGNTPLHFAKTGRVAQTLITHGANVNERNIYEQTPLLLLENTEVINVLISNGADVSVVDIDGNSVIFGLIKKLNRWETASNHKDYLQILEKVIKAGANPTAVNHSGDTPLHMFNCVELHKRIFDVLCIYISHKIKFGTKNARGQTDLNWCLQEMKYAAFLVSTQ